jgi:hypothetical protein
VSEISCSWQTSFTVRSPRNPASTISIFLAGKEERGGHPLAVDWLAELLGERELRRKIR